MEFLTDYGLFAAKTVTIAGAIIAVIVALAVALRGDRESEGGGRLRIKKLNDRYKGMARALDGATLSKREMRQRHKRERREAKDHDSNGEGKTARRRVFVLAFEGDLRASAVATLREEITAVLTVANPRDEVLLRLSSGGGLVHTYGLAASQLVRLREKKIALTVAVDKVAASGGYMMACVGDRVMAAPFAILGSIGVVAQLPNFHRFLKRHDIDFEEHMAGEHKRTITLFGENTPERRDKFQSELEDVHRLFKDFVSTYRPTLSIDAVATGEHWYGVRALELGLVDRLCTSDDYLLEASRDADVIEVRYKPATPWSERLGHAARTALGGALSPMG